MSDDQHASRKRVKPQYEHEEAAAFAFITQVLKKAKGHCTVASLEDKAAGRNLPVLSNTFNFCLETFLP